MHTLLYLIAPNEESPFLRLIGLTKGDIYRSDLDESGGTVRRLYAYSPGGPFKVDLSLTIQVHTRYQIAVYVLPINDG